MTNDLPKLTVWYNTKCPVCDAGIGWQKRRLKAAARSGIIEFRDINIEPDVLADQGLSLEDIRRRLHGRDGTGTIFAGIDCVIAIERRTPGMVWIGRVLALPGVRQVAGFSYDRFADALYAWNRRRGHW
ncbi:MAG: DCC1-like thiol-disulfide oxidoreductase family protein [Hyphomicrobiaceae bacterium]|nr:DCC1-like thiol-disulfide oxidoreductase family protein [Hyphomicrobiaceae bacterium]